MKETSKQITESLKNKIGSPIFGAFILSWLVLNWKSLVIIFAGELDTVKKIEMISKNHDLMSALIVPLMFSIAVAFLSPFIQHAILLIKDRLNVDRQVALARREKELRLNNARTDIAIENMRFSSELFKESFKQRLADNHGRFDADELDRELERFLTRSSSRHEKFITN